MTAGGPIGTPEATLIAEGRGGGRTIPPLRDPGGEDTGGAARRGGTRRGDSNPERRELPWLVSASPPQKLHFLLLLAVAPTRAEAGR